MKVPIAEGIAPNDPISGFEGAAQVGKPGPDRFGAAASEEALQRAAACLAMNGFKVEVLDDAEAARTRIADLIPAGASVFTATSETLRLSGIDADLNISGRYNAVKPRIIAMNRGTQDKEIRQLIASPDIVVGSVAAVTETGSMVAASSTGFQIPAYAAGAGQAILVVGAQKIVPDLNAAMERLETFVFPREDARALAVYGVHSAMNRVLIFKGEPFGRVRVLLVRAVIGF